MRVGETIEVKISIAKQIAAVQKQIAINKISYTHLIGEFKGKIPPGPQLDETNALKAVVRSLRKLK